MDNEGGTKPKWPEHEKLLAETMVEYATAKGIKSTCERCGQARLIFCASRSARSRWPIVISLMAA